MKPKILTVGGQAVIEGVMMKSPSNLAISVRKEDGNIITKKQKLAYSRIKILNFPFIRGIVNLIEMLIIGMKALIWSANQQTDEEDEEFNLKEIILLVGTSMFFAILLFIVLPLYLTKFVTSDKGVLFNLVDGVIRIIFFVIYLWVISFMDDIKILFQYHGAEHKAVYCYEAGEELTLKNVKKFSSLHPRCGTSFIMIVLVLSMLLFSLITSESFYIKLLGRVLLIPVIAAISYELLKLGARFQKNIIIKGVVSPGLLLQRLTTREPTDKQIEVGIKSLRTVLDMEKK